MTESDMIIDYDMNDENSEIYNEINKKRYIRTEKNIKNYIYNFFKSSLALIKNNAFDKYSNYDINQQWKYLVYYREYKGLFGKIFTVYNELVTGLDLFIGSDNKYFSYQNACAFLKCVLFIALNKIIEYKPEKKEKNVLFTSTVDQKDIDLMLNMESNENMNISEDEAKQINLKTFSDQKIITLYVYQIIEKILKDEDDFNELTQNYMTIVANRKQEERIRKNLNLIAILAQDGRKDLRKVILDQKRLGLIDYEDFEDILNEDIQAGEDKPVFDRDMELLDDLQNEDVDGHLIEEKRKDKLLEYDIEEDEFSYMAGEDEDDLDNF
jgi:hypothetical protein